jgi:hypothetical protein
MGKVKRKTDVRLKVRRAAARAGESYKQPGSQNRHKSFPSKKSR